MSQNRSSAVMQARAEAHDSLDDFPTPPWSTRALCEHVGKSEPLWDMVVREPAANRGFMARPLAEYFKSVEASDVHDYGAGYPVRDYLFPEPLAMVDWTITNPPFRLAEAFIRRGLETSREGVAVIVRSAFLEGQGRYAALFSPHPPSTILQFTERVVMHKGRLPDPNVAVLNAGSGRMEKPTTATAYAWLIWTHDLRPRGLAHFGWIAPCRAALERPGDYEDVTLWGGAEVAMGGVNDA